MSAVALWSPSDYVLSVLAPLAVAASRSSCLVVDLDTQGPIHPSPYTLADLVSDGPTAAQLEPRKGPPHLLPNGGVAPHEAREVVSALVDRWPNVVLRCPPAEPAPSDAIQLIPLLPTPTRVSRGPVVFQDLGFGVEPPNGTTSVRRPRRSTIESLINHRVPLGSRWVRDLAAIWRLRESRA